MRVLQESVPDSAGTGMKIYKNITTAPVVDHPEKPITCTFEDKEFDDTLGDYDNE